MKLLDEVRAAVRKRYGSNLTWKQRRDAGAKVVAEVLWADGEKDLQELVTDNDEGTWTARDTGAEATVVGNLLRHDDRGSRCDSR